jgi:Tetratricopeptide repeat.
MKFRSLPIFCLLLCVFACGRHNSLRQKAYQSLETVVRLYESGDDSIDVDLLEPALAYFPEKGDAFTKGRLWFQQGFIHYNHGRFDKAIVSFEKALEQTRLSGDRHLEGLICRSMADTYNHAYNIREDTVYLRRAWLAFSSEEDSLYRAETALRLAAAYMNGREWEKAGPLLEQAVPVSGRYPLLFGRCMGVYATYLLDSPQGDPALSRQCFEAAAEAGYTFADDKLCDWGYAMYLSGRKAEALRLWDSLDRAHPEGLQQLQFRRYQRFREEGETGKALALLEESAMRQDSLLRIQTSEAVSMAQRDYQEAVAEGERLAAARERDRKRTAWIVGILAAVLLGMLCFVIWREGRDRLVTARRALEESQKIRDRLVEAEQLHLKKIQALERSIRNRKSSLEDIRSEYLYMLRDGYRRLGRLFEDKQFAESQTQTETVLYRRVCEIVKDIDGDSKGFQRLQQYIEDHLGSPISSLRKDIPTLGEKDIRLFCYLVIGYDAPLISALMNVGKESTIYCWKNRLLGKIRRLPVTKAGRYLDLVR